MSVCRSPLYPWFGFLLFATDLANAQQNFGVVQGRIAEGVKEVQITGSIMLQKQATSIALTVPVSFNGSKSTWWIVDTGAPICIIDPSLSKQLGLQTDSNIGKDPVAMISGLRIGTFRCDGIACAVKSNRKTQREGIQFLSRYRLVFYNVGRFDSQRGAASILQN
jgi:hypothetical protein